MARLGAVVSLALASTLVSAGAGAPSPAREGRSPAVPFGVDTSPAPAADRTPPRAGRTPELAVPPPAAHAGARSRQGRFIERAYTGEHGSRRYKLYIPSGYEPETPAPLVVMLHGCVQDPDDFAAGTRMNALAEEATVLVAYPAQPASAHPQKCWRWYDPAHQRRDGGEPAIIAGITHEVTADYAVDPARVYVAGMSAGAAMSVVMGATHPELYAAIGAHSGVLYRGATAAADALRIMKAGVADPAAHLDAAFEAGRDAPARAVVPAIVFHGAADAVVDVENAHAAVAQWAQTLDLADDGEDDDSVDDVPDDERAVETPAGYHATQSSYRDAEGRVVIERWIVGELGHAWSGGSPDGSYSDPAGPDAGREMLRFFLERSRPPGTATAPKH